LNEQGERLVEIHRKLSDREVEVIALRADVAERDKSIENLKTVVDVRDATIAELRKRKNNLSNAAAGRDKEIFDLRVRLSATEGKEEAGFVGAAIHCYSVASHTGATIEQAAHEAHAVSKLFPCSIGFRFDGTGILIAPGQSPEHIVDHWRRVREHEAAAQPAAPSPAGDRAERDGAETASHGVEDLLRFEVVRLERELDRARSLIGDHKDAIASLRASLAAVAERERWLVEEAKELETRLVAASVFSHGGPDYKALCEWRSALASYPTPETAPAEDQPDVLAVPTPASPDDSRYRELGLVDWAKEVVWRHDRPQSYHGEDMTEAIHELRCAIARHEAKATPEPAPAEDQS
jgi:hypothetical protein